MPRRNSPSEMLHIRFSTNSSSRSGKLWKALFAAYGAPYAVAAGLKIVQDALAFLQPQLLRWLLIFIADYQHARNSNAELPSAVKGFSIVAVMVRQSSRSCAKDVC
jgi:ATP-binding cassette subfamily C (CFTR/MRP) protein 1